MTAAATEETPEVAGQALKAIVTGLQSVAKGRQEVHAANDIQVHPDLQHCCMHDGSRNTTSVTFASDTFVFVMSKQPPASFLFDMSISCLRPLQIQLAVFRYPDRDSDILVTLNTPIYINEASAAAQHTGAGHKTAHSSAPKLFASMLRTFHIFDYSLFG